MYNTDPRSMAIHQRMMEELRFLATEHIKNRSLYDCLINRWKNFLSIYFPSHNLKKQKKNDDTHNYFSNNRIVIYTTIHGNYDSLKEPITVPDNCDFFVITDQPVKSDSIWKKREVDFGKWNYKVNDILKSRFVKIMGHKIFPEYDFSIYVDGTIQIRTDLTEFIQDMGAYGLKLHNHPTRQCVYKELNSCLKNGKESSEKLFKQKEHLKEEELPKNIGLLETGILIRDFSNPICVKVMEAWWDELYNYSSRDQISLAYVLWKNNISIRQIGVLGPNLRRNYAFIKHSHTRKAKAISISSDNNL